MARIIYRTRFGFILAINFIAIIVASLTTEGLIGMWYFFEALFTRGALTYWIPHFIIIPIIVGLLLFDWFSSIFNRLTGAIRILFIIIIFILFPIVCILLLADQRYQWIKTRVTDLIFASIFIYSIILAIELLFVGLIFVQMFLIVINIGILSFIGSVKTTNSYKDKDFHTKSKNLILNIILIGTSALLGLIFSLVQGWWLLLVPGLTIINCIIDLLTLNNTPQKFRFSLKDNGNLRRTPIDKFSQALDAVWQIARKNINCRRSSIGGVLLFLTITMVVNFSLILFPVYFGSGDHIHILLIILLFIQVFVIGIILFFEFIVHIPFNRSVKLNDPENKSMRTMETMRTSYKKIRLHTHKGIFIAAVSSIVLFMISFFFIKAIDMHTFLFLMVYFSGEPFLIFTGIILTPFALVITLLIILILIMALLAPGYITKNPISGAIAGMFNGLAYSLWILMFGIAGPATAALTILAMIICAIFGCLSGLIMWLLGGKLNLGKSRKTETVKETQVS
ncbi:MAG: hypothetical protein FK733_16760 [Asgard group archaeon]|nr:hypothetical protein [Asgard group archaeon]